MSKNNSYLFWFLLFGVVIAIVCLLKSILFPFVTGILIAYLLDPLADFFEKKLKSRSIASLISLIIFFIVLISVLFLIIPIIYSQFIKLVEAFPAYAEAFHQSIQPLISKIQNYVSSEEIDNFSELGKKYGGDALLWIANFFGKVLSGGWAVFNLLSVFFITPVIAFFMIRDWDIFIKKIDDLLPRHNAAIIRDQCVKIDETLSGFLRGQGLACIILAAYYGIGLTIAGLDFGILIGLFTGIMSFIPYVGFLIGAVLSIGFALLQFSEWIPILSIVIIFAIGQLLEGYVIIPKFVGKSVGLNEVWIVFALLAGGHLMGFVGILVAVPLAAVISVLIKFGIETYKSSKLYNLK